MALPLQLWWQGEADGLAASPSAQGTTSLNMTSSTWPRISAHQKRGGVLGKPPPLERSPS